MNTTLRAWFRLFVLVVCTAWTSVNAGAQTCPPNPNCNGCPLAEQTFTCTIPPEVPSGQLRTCQAPSFDSNLGQLLGVRLTATFTAQDGRFRFENLDTDAGCPGNADPNAWFVNADVQLFEPSSATPFCQQLNYGSCSGSIPAVSTFDNVIDFGVPGGGDCPTPTCLVGSGYTQNCTTPAPFICPATCITNPARMAAFTTNGPGQVTFSFGSVANQAEASGCGKIISAIRIRVGAVVTVTYTYCTNTPPTANPDSATACTNGRGQSGFIDIPILRNDCDADGSIDCGSIVITNPPDSGAFSIVGCSGVSGLTGCPQANNCPGCFVRYTPNVNFSGPDSFQYTVEDNENCLSNVATVSINVTAPPNAVDDPALTTCRNTPLTIDVLANDVPAAGSFLNCSTLAIISGPTNNGGTAAPSNCNNPNAGCTATCRVLFTPNASFLGLTSFVYEITDSRGCKDTATVTVRVCAPTANNDNGAVCQGQCVDLNVLGNDSTAAGCTVGNCGTIVIVDPPDHGTAQPNAQCTGSAPGCVGGCRVRYCNNDPTFVGVDSFTYTVRDANGCVSNPATVTVTINPSPALLDRKVVKEVGNDAPITNIPVLEGATPGTGCTLLLNTLTITQQPSFGTVTVNADGTVNYDPDAAFPGSDVFCFSIQNSCGCPDTACVEVNEPDECVERNRRECASLLLYPEYQNRPGMMTVNTITYGCCEDQAPGVWVEFIYIRGDDCTEQNRTVFLTPCDTFTWLTTQHAPAGSEGYMYAFAKSASSPGSTPIVFNRLIGNLMVFDGLKSLNYSMNTVGFKGIGTEGSLNDEDGDGVRDLDGVVEYEEAPDKIFVPRFMGQDPGTQGFNSELILVALSGGTAFDFAGGTEVGFAIFDDNENAFSANYRFYCWAKPRLKDISGAFLQSTIHQVVAPIDDPDEIQGLPNRDAGWFIVDGIRASSFAETIVDPAIYAVLVERRGVWAVADLPFEFCSQANGDLLPEGVFGDPRPGFPGGQAGDNQ
ncbi:MAG: Ig-like domain-containing protein [Planctomycetota bacterium]